MVFLKPLQDLKFEDIEQLKSNMICESQILEYKEQLIDDDKLLKQISAFANTQGGFLIFGVKEIGRGGYPKDILGINKTQVNWERMEQIILSNIQPRLNVKIQPIEHQDSSKIIIVVQIPDSYLKPHMNSRDSKFYKRYEFEASPMTETEVSDMYRRRFTGYQEMESYISNLLELKEILLITPQIVGQIIVTPTILGRMIETSNAKEFEWLNKLDFKPKGYVPSYAPSSPRPSPNGIKCELIGKYENVVERIEVHRNGCVHHILDIGYIY